MAKKSKKRANYWQVHKNKKPRVSTELHKKKHVLQLIQALVNVAKAALKFGLSVTICGREVEIRAENETTN